MNDFVSFDVKQFASGEYQVTIKDRIYNQAYILYDWFNEKERDLMLLLTKIGAVRKNYGMIDIIVYAPYLPYARQDRVFEVGQDIAIETFVNAVKMDNKITVSTDKTAKYGKWIKDNNINLDDKYYTESTSVTIKKLKGE